MTSIFSRLALLCDPADRKILRRIEASLFMNLGDEQSHSQAPVMRHRRAPVRRKPSLAVALRQAAKAGRPAAAASKRPDGTIVLQFQHNLGDNHVPAIPPDNPWDEVLKR